MINPSSGGGDELVVCAACGAENRAHSRFCERCGTRLPQPIQGAAPEERPVGATNAQPEAREDATVAFERPPLEPFPVQDDPVANAAPFVPLAAPASGESPAHGGTDEPPANVAGSAWEAPAVAAHEDTAPIRNAPTMSFDLPKLPISASIEPIEPVEPVESAGGPLPPSARDAPTMSFDLPPSSPSFEGVADVVAPADPVPSPTARTAQGPEGGWNYQSWKPLPPGEQGQVAEERSDGTRRLGAVPSPVPASAWPEPVVAPEPAPVEPPQRQPEGYQSSPPQSPPQWYGPPSAPLGPGASVTYPTPGAGQQAGAPPTAPARIEAVAPASPYPAQPYDPTRAAAPPDQTRAAAPYGGVAAAAGPYPAPAATNNNRTLWIVLGVLGGVLFLCLAGCLLIVLLTGVVGASSSVGVATRVATITGP